MIKNGYLMLTEKEFTAFETLLRENTRSGAIKLILEHHGNWSYSLKHLNNVDKYTLIEAVCNKRYKKRSIKEYLNELQDGFEAESREWCLIEKIKDNIIPDEVWA